MTAKTRPPILLDVQRQIAAAIMRPLTAGNKMQRRYADGRRTAHVAAEFIKPSHRLSAFERLEIYNRQYWFRILDCFYDDYPGLRAILGDKSFSILAREYLIRYPSTSYTLRDLGQDLIDFIRANPMLTKPHFREAIDMARLEWAHIEAFDSASKTPITADDLLGCDPAAIHLRLQPYITLLHLDYPVDDFLIQLKEEGGFRAEASNSIAGRRRTQPFSPRRLRRQRVIIAVHRHQNSVYYKRLTAEQHRLLHALECGASLESACRSIKKASQVQNWFRDWSALGWFWIERAGRCRS